MRLSFAHSFVLDEGRRFGCKYLKVWEKAAVSVAVLASLNRPARFLFL